MCFLIKMLKQAHSFLANLKSTGSLEATVIADHFLLFLGFKDLFKMKKQLSV